MSSLRVRANIPSQTSRLVSNDDFRIERSPWHGSRLERDRAHSHRRDQSFGLRRQRRSVAIGRIFRSFVDRNRSELLKHIESIGKHIAALKQAARKAGIPVIYVNDNFGKWKSDFHNVIEYVINENKPGTLLVAMMIST